MVLGCADESPVAPEPEFAPSCGQFSLLGENCCPENWGAPDCRKMTGDEIEDAKTALEAIFAKAGLGWDSKPNCRAAYDEVYGWLDGPEAAEVTCSYGSTIPSSWGWAPQPNDSIKRLGILEYFLTYLPSTEKWLGTIFFHEGLHMAYPEMTEPQVEDLQSQCGVVNPIDL